MKLEHIVRFKAGHDCIRFECAYKSAKCKPHSDGSHGVGGLDICFYSKGPEGTIQFILYTGWLPQHAKPSNIGHRNITTWGRSPTMPADLGYHSKKSHYEGQNIISDTCEFCDGQPCYYDGSGLNASDAMYALVNGGEDALWKFLDAYYLSVFHDGKYPNPAEYSMPLRKKN